MARIGLVALDSNGRWMGGRYYLQHLVKMTAAVPAAERLGICDLWWQQAADEDPFCEIRSLLAERVVVRLPSTPWNRAKRRVRRTVHRWPGARDLFLDADIGVVFPILPCEAPGVPFAFWLPDFQHLRMPELFTDEMRQSFESSYTRNVALATRVVLSSQNALQDFQQVYPESVSKARVLHFCSVPDDEWWRLDPRRVATDKGLPDAFFVVSNQFARQKNHPVVFEAVRLLRDRGVRITVACTGSTYGFHGDDYFPEIRSFLERHDLDDQIIILGLLPRAEQVALIRRSVAVLQPSRFEGWATAVEDAKTLGKTLLASDIPVHREQLGPDHPWLVDPRDPEAWASAISEVASAQAPGPDQSQEAAAALQLADRQLAYGRAFLNTMRETMRATDGPGSS